MAFDPSDTTLDGFLDGRLQVRQPKIGYRAATDPVFLAASVNVGEGQSVLELGCGVGVASLCLAWRVPGLVQSAVEIQDDYAELARANARENDVALSVFTGDITHLPQDLRVQSFDHVMFNPPFFGENEVTPPDDAGKVTAHVEETLLDQWISIGLKRLKPKGSLAIIHLSARLPEILAGLVGIAGDIRILPLAPRAGREAKRVIVVARKGTAGQSRLLAPLNVHSASSHQEGGSDFGPEAAAVLRDGKSLLHLMK